MLLTKNMSISKDFEEGSYKGIIQGVTCIVKEQLATEYIQACSNTDIKVEVGNLNTDLALKFTIIVDGYVMNHVVYHSDKGKMSPIEYEVYHLAKQLNIYGDNSMLEILNLAIDHIVDIEVRRSECGRYLNKSFRVIANEVNELADILV